MKIRRFELKVVGKIPPFTIRGVMLENSVPLHFRVQRRRLDMQQPSSLSLPSASAYEGALDDIGLKPLNFVRKIDVRLAMISRSCSSEATSVKIEFASTRRASSLLFITAGVLALRLNSRIAF
jgi:hypothetical protein